MFPKLSSVASESSALWKYLLDLDIYGRMYPDVFSFILKEDCYILSTKTCCGTHFGYCWSPVIFFMLAQGQHHPPSYFSYWVLPNFYYFHPLRSWRGFWVNGSPYTTVNSINHLIFILNSIRIWGHVTLCWLCLMTCSLLWIVRMSRVVAWQFSIQWNLFFSELVPYHDHWHQIDSHSILFEVLMKNLYSLHNALCDPFTPAQIMRFALSQDDDNLMKFCSTQILQCLITVGKFIESVTEWDCPFWRHILHFIGLSFDFDWSVS